MKGATESPAPCSSFHYLTMQALNERQRPLQAVTLHSLHKASVCAKFSPFGSFFFPLDDDYFYQKHICSIIPVKGQHCNVLHGLLELFPLISFPFMAKEKKT